MPRSSLEQTINRLLKPDEVSRSCDCINLVSTIITNQEVSYLLTESPLRTVSDVVLWVSTTNVLNREISGEYTVLIDTYVAISGTPCRLSDVHSVTISGSDGNICDVQFHEGTVFCVSHGGECTRCNNIVEHEGGFVLNIDDSQVGYVPFS